MGNNLIIFAGAGASRGVSKEKYPMAIDFRNRLPDSIVDSPLYIQLFNHLKSTGLNDGVDIEHILWELGKLNETLTESTESDRFLSLLLRTNQIADITKHQNSGQATYSQFSNLKTTVNSLQSLINEQVYDYYSAPPSPEELNFSWVPLLKKILLLDFEKIDIFTTNYDLVIEYALNTTNSKKISMGLKDGLNPSINLNEWRDEDKKNTGMLTKLHGSVDWKLGKGGTESDPIIRRGHPEFDGDHSKRLILYPGFKGVPSKEPFVVFHNYFRQQLKKCSHILFIGFAFRDDFINELILSELPSNCKVAVINPQEKLPKLNFLKKAFHLRNGFNYRKTLKTVLDESAPALSVDSLTEWLK
ncbi:MAG: SIR2 family protein [Methylotenera sp.]|nr:SIR2 family protein [Methylotenera sp.]